MDVVARIDRRRSWTFKIRYRNFVSWLGNGGAGATLEYYVLPEHFVRRSTKYVLRASLWLGAQSLPYSLAIFFFNSLTASPQGLPLETTRGISYQSPGGSVLPPGLADMPEQCAIK